MLRYYYQEGGIGNVIFNLTYFCNSCNLLRCHQYCFGFNYQYQIYENL